MAGEGSDVFRAAVDRIEVVRGALGIAIGGPGERGEHPDQHWPPAAALGWTLVWSPNRTTPMLPEFQPPMWAPVTIDGRGPTGRGPKAGSGSGPEYRLS